MENIKNKIVKLKISSVHVLEDNSNENIFSYEKVKQSVQDFGQIKNIVVCQTEQGFECLDGTKTLKALKELNQESVVAFNLGDLSIESKEKVKKALENEEPLFYFLGDLDIKNEQKVEENIKKAEPYKKEEKAQEAVSAIEEKPIENFSENLEEVRQKLEEKVEEIKQQNNEQLETKDVTANFLDNIKSLKKSTEAEDKKESKFQESIVLPNGEEVIAGDVVLISTQRKTDFQVQLSKFTKKWVYYIEVESQKPLNIDMERFLATCKTLKQEINETNETVEKTQETASESERSSFTFPIDLDNLEKLNTEEPVVEAKESEENKDFPVMDFSGLSEESKEFLSEEVSKDFDSEKVQFYIEKNEQSLIILNSTRDIIKFLENEIVRHFNEIAKTNQFEKATINFNIDVDGKITIKESLIVEKSKSEKALNVYEIESILKITKYQPFYQIALSNSSFYFDYKRGTINLKDNKESILLNLKSVGKNLVKDKWQSDVDEENISYSVREKENGELEIISLTSKNQYGVVIRLQLIDVANFLFKVDF